MKQQFIEHKFSAASEQLLSKIDGVLTRYEAQGFKLSLRQLYYQLVAAGWIENSLRSYKNIGQLVSTARQSGDIDWDMIEDRNRETVIPAHWESPSSILQACASSFRINKWEVQPCHIEVMVEKDALTGVLEPVCRKLDIGLTANRGYCSSSTMYEIGDRLEQAINEGKYVTILYLGDHDPSGIDMTRDVETRLKMYASVEEGSEEEDLFEVVRVALNWDQVQLWKPPENPVKEKDARRASYVKQFGLSSWELDAIHPDELAKLINQEVETRCDWDLWDEAVAKEKAMRDDLIAMATEYKKNHKEER